LHCPGKDNKLIWKWAKRSWDRAKRWEGDWIDVGGYWFRY